MMTTRVKEGFQHEYCPKFDEDRQIRARLVEETALGDRKYYVWTHFECPEQNRCEHFNGNRGCPFISKALARFAGRI